MRKFILSAALLAMLPVSAYAQASKPTGQVEFSKVPADSVLSYSLIGLKLTNGANENVGEIKDVVIDQGKLAGYILSVGGFLGMGEHYVDVSPASVAINYDQKNTKWTGMINATKDQLKGAPEFKYDGRFKH